MNPDQIDGESLQFLNIMGESEKVRGNRIPGVKVVLVVLSSRGMVFDVEALRQKVMLTYPEAAVFFHTTDGKSIGSPAPQQVDLLIDFTGPGQRQGLFQAKKLRRMARVAVGRNAGLFRKRIYDRVFDEKVHAPQMPAELLARERHVQKHVLSLAGVAFVQAGDTLPDRSKSIALELPLMSR